MTRVLAGDVGGTKTILRLVEITDGARSITEIGSGLVTVSEATYPSREYVDLVPLVRSFLATAGVTKGSADYPVRACFGLAGPVKHGVSRLTNLGWFLEDHRLAVALEIDRVDLINDFAAVGYGIVGLQASDFHCLQPGQPQPGAPIAFLGAGTGLGQGYALPLDDRLVVLPSEGGHADFAPRSPLEWDLLTYLLDKYGISRLSVERIVSGAGLVAIYQFLRDRSGGGGDTPADRAVRQWESETGRPDKSVEPGAVISQAAIAGDDSLCQQALDLFVAAYGAEAGNLALKMLPFGGLYLAGGIAPKILPALTSGLFLENFASKGRLGELLATVPVSIVLNPQVGLIGAAVCAAQITH